MPDHLHLILCGQSDGADAKAAMDAFKTRAGLWLGVHRPGWCWQDGYHDHIIRKSDDWRRHLHYIYVNPMRAGLVDDPAAWPHTGAMGFHLVESMMDANIERVVQRKALRRLRLRLHASRRLGCALATGRRAGQSP